jgi:predicted dithiol-disulfide oxidoreductase (DUF899 family)
MTTQDGREGAGAPTEARVREAFERVRAAKTELLALVRARGPEPVADHTLRNPDGTEVRLSALFGEHDDLLVVHNMGRGCSYCTLWADGLTGFTPHFARRCAFVLCSDDEPETVGAFAEERGWGFRCVSGRGSAFTGAMGYRNEKGGPIPGVSAFHRSGDGTIVRTGHTPFGPGDDYCALWPLFDLLQEGSDGFIPR